MVAQIRDRQAVTRIVRLASTSGDGYTQIVSIVLLDLLNQQSIVYSLMVPLANELPASAPDHTTSVTTTT